MFIGKSINYSTEVTATKGEQIVIWTIVIVGFGMIFSSLFFDWPTWVRIVSIVGTIFGTLGTMIFMVFRPKHREERKKNARINGVLVSERKQLEGKAKEE